MRRSVAVFFASWILSGCTTVGGMAVSESSGGQVQSYDVSYKKAFELARYACTSLDLKIDSESVERGFIVASNGVSAMSWGERIGIYLKKTAEDRTEIRVVSKAKMKTNVFAPKWETEIQSTIQGRVAQLKDPGKLQ